jgi:hypothetical protein
MDTKPAIFAFKLAEQNETDPTATGWRARDGVSVAGCTDPSGLGLYRESVYYGGWPAPPDEGYWC